MQFEENPWMIYCQLFNLCFLYFFTSSQPEPFISPFISPLQTLIASECVLMDCLDPALTLAALLPNAPENTELGVRPEFQLGVSFL